MAQKILSAFGIGIIAMLFLVSCEDEPSSSSKLTFKGVNLNNAKALALVQEGNGGSKAPRKMPADEGEKPQTKFLYTVDEEGNMNAAIFYFNEVDSTTNTKALRLSIFAKTKSALFTKRKVQQNFKSSKLLSRKFAAFFNV